MSHLTLVEGQIGTTCMPKFSLEQLGGKEKEKDIGLPVRYDLRDYSIFHNFFFPL